MPQPYDYVGLMGGPDAFRVGPAVQDAITGQQAIQQNNNLLQQQNSQLEAQKRQDAARQALAHLVSNPDTDEATFQQLLPTIAAADPAAASGLVQQRRMNAHLASTISNPTPKNIFQFTAQYPEVGKQVQDALKTMNEGARDSMFRTASDTYGYLQAGDTEGAIKVLQAHIDADEAAGIDTSAYKPMLDVIREDPKRAMFIAGSLIAGHVGPEKFADTFKIVGEGRRADELQPSEVALKQTEAKYAPKKAESELKTAEAQRQRWAAQTADEIESRNIDWERLGLDQDKLTSEIEMKMAELDANGTQLSDASRGEVNKAVASAQTGYALADKATDIATRFRLSGARGGFGSSFSETVKRTAGMQDNVSQLRTQFTQLVNSAALKSLPPGPASDKDVKFVLAGFPKATDPANYVADWMDAFGRVQKTVAEADDRRGNWIAANGSLAPARRDIDVMGTTIPAGTTFNEYSRNMAKLGGRKEQSPAVQALIDRYKPK